MQPAMWCLWGKSEPAISVMGVMGTREGVSESLHKGSCIWHQECEYPYPPPYDGHSSCSTGHRPQNRSGDAGTCGFEDHRHLRFVGEDCPAKGALGAHIVKKYSCTDGFSFTFAWR